MNNVVTTFCVIYIYSYYNNYKGAVHKTDVLFNTVECIHSYLYNYLESREFFSGLILCLVSYLPPLLILTILIHYSSIPHSFCMQSSVHLFSFYLEVTNHFSFQVIFHLISFTHMYTTLTFSLQMISICSCNPRSILYLCTPFPILPCKFYSTFSDKQFQQLEFWTYFLHQTPMPLHHHSHAYPKTFYCGFVQSYFYFIRNVST